MNLFLDANILVSVLNKEYPVFTDSSRILSLVDNHKFTIYTSPICLAIAWYFAEKKSGINSARIKMELLCKHINIADSNSIVVNSRFSLNSIINKSYKSSEIKRNYFNAITRQSWFIVIDFLSFHDLKEVGKLNK
jgi:predicted nucleic acid-binding protein